MMSEPMNKYQTAAMLNHLAGHSMTAANQMMGNNAKFTKEEQWDRVAGIVSLLGSKKTAKQCRDHWALLKKNAKNYHAQKTVFYKRKTGNDCSEHFQVNEVYENVLRIVGNSHKNGLNFGTELGITAGPSISGKRKANNRVVYEVLSDEEALASVLDVSSATKKARTSVLQKSLASHTASNYAVFESQSSLAQSPAVNLNQKSAPSHNITQLIDTYRTPLSDVNINSRERGNAHYANFKSDSSVPSTSSSNAEFNVVGVGSSTESQSSFSHFKQLANQLKVSNVNKRNFELNMEKSSAYSNYAKSWNKKSNSYKLAMDQLGEQTNALNRLTAAVESLSELHKNQSELQERYYTKKLELLEQRKRL